jgi:cell shape-determining protein MreC
VSAITLTSPLAPGTVFATNALQGGLFPPGLPVAKVAAATLTPGSATWDLALRPSADLAHLHYVNVLIWEPST